MTNADRMTHPIIPQKDTFVTLEYLESLGIDENFKVSDYAKKSEIPEVPDLTYYVQAHLKRETNITPEIKNDCIFLRFNQAPISGLQLRVNAYTWVYSNDRLIIFNITFTSESTITYTVEKQPYGSNATCTYDSTNLTLKLTSYYTFKAYDDVFYEIINDTAPDSSIGNLILSNNNTSYEVYLKEQLNDKIDAISFPKITTITLIDPTLSSESPSTASDNEYEITVTQNLSEFVYSAYLSKVNSLSVSASIMIIQTLSEAPVQSIVYASCNIANLEETCKMNIDRVDFAHIDEITCNVSTQLITIHVKANSSYPILGSGVLSITVEFGNRTAHKLTFGDKSFNITSLQIF